MRKRIAEPFFAVLLSGVLIFTGMIANAQKRSLLPPSGLMTDLIENSSYQSHDGYPVKSSAANLENKNIQSVLIANEHPAMSWQMNDGGRDSYQTAYQIVLADNTQFMGAWDSGKIPSSQSSGVVYNGPALKPNSSYYWKIRIWNNHRQVSAYSEPAVFYTAPVLRAYQSASYPLEITEVEPKALQKVNGIFRIDFGKDAFGTLKLKLNPQNDGDSVIVRLGEVVNPDGSINQHPPGTIRYSHYILRLSKGIADYKIAIRKDKLNTQASAIKMPDYIGEVTPFRYAEIEGYHGELHAQDITQLSVHYPFNDEATKFTSSETTLNAIWKLSKYSMKATSFTGYFIDGDRERTPYEADAYIAQLSEYAVDKEYTLARRSSEYLIMHPTWPTEWILQSNLIAWNDYLYTGNIQSIKNYYADLKAKALMPLEDSTGLISTRNGKMTKAVTSSVHFNGDLRDIVDWPLKTETDSFVFTKYNAVVNAYYYKNLVVLAQMAKKLGNDQDALFFNQKAERFKAVYNKAFFDPVRKIYVDGADIKHASLHSNMFAMAFGLVGEENRTSVLSFIKSRGMACSVYGAQFLLDAIYDAGDGDYGLALLTSKTDRSWYNMIRAGSTITMEAWDNKYKPNQDWNHAWGAAAANIISRKLMGIEPAEPGWSNFTVKPQIGDLNYAEIDVPTIKGNVHARYSQGANSFNAIISVPANSSAKVYLPLKSGKNFTLRVDNKKIRANASGKSILVEKVGSGQHVFKVVYQ